MSQPGLTPAQVLATTADRLRAAGVESPHHDAESLLAHVLGATRGEVAGGGSLVRSDRRLTPDEVESLEALVGRRARREPLQHLLGSAGFRYLELEVGPGVFVPRPETEVMTGVAVDELRERQARGAAAPLAVDLCTGSGAVAASMASEARGARIVAIELSDSAYTFAVRNAGPLGVEVRLGDMAHGVDDLSATVDVVTANPPYIPIGEFESVAPEARDFDPPLALWSGQDGLDAIRVVEDVAARLLLPGGLLLCEHADSQSEAAVAVFAGTGRWRDVADHPDLTGRPRFVTARRATRRRAEDGSRLAP